MILLTGSRGVVGRPLLKRLRSEGIAHMSVSRSEYADVQWDMESQAVNQIVAQLDGCTKMIHCAPIWVLSGHLDDLIKIGIQSFVVFSSTSVVSKINSEDAGEQLLVRQLDEAERQLRAIEMRSDISLTILRPSMIYGYGRDQNIMKIADFIDRFGFIVLAGKAQGLRQPVHADDLVDAALEALSVSHAAGSTYNLAGAEVLTYRQMVEKIFEGLGKPIRIVSMPVWLYGLALRMATLFTSFTFTSEMAKRMSQNLSYDWSRAKADINFSPQPFLEQPARDLRVSKEPDHE